MKILGIESTFDDFSMGIVQNGQSVLFHTKKSFPRKQIKKFGGVIPNMAADYHIQSIKFLLNKIKSFVNQVDAIAFSNFPGLFSCVSIGAMSALAFFDVLRQKKNISLFPINHRYGHIFSFLLEQNIEYDIKKKYLCFVFSGGSSECYVMQNGFVKSIYQHLDDALGEFLDKSARFMGLVSAVDIENMAYGGHMLNITWPKLSIKNFKGFSFSGLKTYVKNNIISWRQQYNLRDICFTIQENVFNTIIQQILYLKQKQNLETIIVSGGVSINKCFRQKLQQHNILLTLPKYCLDNGCMIGSAAFFLYKYHNLSSIEDFTLFTDDNI